MGPLRGKAVLRTGGALRAWGRFAEKAVLRTEGALRAGPLRGKGRASHGGALRAWGRFAERPCFARGGRFAHGAASRKRPCFARRGASRWAAPRKGPLRGKGRASHGGELLERRRGGAAPSAEAALAQRLPGEAGPPIPSSSAFPAKPGHRSPRAEGAPSGPASPHHRSSAKPRFPVTPRLRPKATLAQRLPGEAGPPIPSRRRRARFQRPRQMRAVIESVPPGAVLTPTSRR